MVANTRMQGAAQAREATPLLRFLASELCVAVAGVWRAPHADFLALPAARRHAAAIVLSGLARAPVGQSDLRRLLEFGRDAAVAEMLAGEAAPGLMRALGKAGEVLWPRKSYAAFLDLFGQPAGNAALRHMEAITPDTLAPLRELPEALRTASVLRILSGLTAARDLARAFRLATVMRAPEARQRLVERWTSGGDVAAVFLRAGEDLTPEEFRPPLPPPDLPPPLLRLSGRRQLEQAGLELRNCLAEHAARAADGRLAFYLQRSPRAAAVALAQDAAGWRLAEARGLDNTDLDEEDLRRLAGMLAGLDVRTGPSLETLRRRLGDHAYGMRPDREPADDFVAGLELGDLWS